MESQQVTPLGEKPKNSRRSRRRRKSGTKDVQGIVNDETKDGDVTMQFQSVCSKSNNDSDGETVSEKRSEHSDAKDRPPSAAPVAATADPATHTGKSSDDEMNGSASTPKRKSRAKHRREVKKYKHRMAQKQKQQDAETWHNELYLLRDAWENDGAGALAETVPQNVVVSASVCKPSSEKVIGYQSDEENTGNTSLTPEAKQAQLSSGINGITDGNALCAVGENPASTLISDNQSVSAQGEFDFEFFSMQEEHAGYTPWHHNDAGISSPCSWANDDRYASAIVDSTFLAELSRRMSAERTTLKETVSTHRNTVDAAAKNEKSSDSRQIAVAPSRTAEVARCPEHLVRPPKSSYPIVGVNECLNQNSCMSGGVKRNHIQLRHVEAVPPLPMPVPLAPGTDLILPTRNYLSVDPVFNIHAYMPGFHRDEKVLSHSLISTALCNQCVAACDGALVVSSDEALRSLFEAALDDKPVAISAHRVGHMVLLTSEQPKLLKSTAEKNQEHSLIGKTMYRINENLSRADVLDRDAGGRSTENATNTEDAPNPDNHAAATQSRKKISHDGEPCTRLPLQVAPKKMEVYTQCSALQNVGTQLERSTTEHHLPSLRVGTLTGNRAAEKRSRYSRMLHWKMGSLGLLVGLNTPVVLDQRTNVEAILSLADISRPMASEQDKQRSALRSWFDATLANVGSVGVYTHEAGIVKRFDVRKVSDLLDSADGRLASAAMNFTSDALHWIVSQCSRDGRSYAVVRNYTSNTLEIYESPQSSTAWDGFVRTKTQDADIDESMCIGSACLATTDGSADEVSRSDSRASPSPPPCIAGKSKYATSCVSNQVVCTSGTGDEQAGQQCTTINGSREGAWTGERTGTTNTATAAAAAAAGASTEDSISSRRREEAARTNWKLGIMCFHIATRLCEDDECVVKAVPLLERCFSIFVQQSHRPDALRHMRAVAERLVSIVQRLLSCSKIDASTVYTDLPCKYRDALLTCGHFATRIYHALQEKNIHSARARVVFIECLLFSSAAICIAVARTIARVNVIRDIFRKLREASVRPDRDSNLEIHNKVMKDMLQVAVEGLVKLEWARNVLLAAVETPHVHDTGASEHKGAGALVDARLEVPRVESVDTSVSELYGDLVLLTMSDPSPFTAQVLADVSLRIMSRDPATSHLTTLQWLSTIKHDQVTLSFTALKSYGKAGSTRRLLLKNAHVYYFVGCHYLATDRHTKALEALHRSDKLFSVAELAEEDFTFCCCATETFITKGDIYCVLGEVYLRMARVRVASSDSSSGNWNRSQSDTSTTHWWPELPLAFGGASHLSTEEERCWTNAIDYFSKSGSAHAHMAITLLAFVSRRIDNVVASGVRASAAFARDASAKLTGAKERCSVLAPFCEWETLRLATCTDFDAEIMEMAHAVERRWSGMVYVKQGTAQKTPCVVSSQATQSHILVPLELYISEDEARLQVALVHCVEMEHSKDGCAAMVAQRVLVDILASLGSSRASGETAPCCELGASHSKLTESNTTTPAERKSKPPTHDGTRKRSRVRTRSHRGIDFLPFPKPCSRGHGHTASMDEFHTAMQPRAISTAEKKEFLANRAAENGFDDIGSWVYHMNAQILQRVGNVVAPYLPSSRYELTTRTQNATFPQPAVNQSLDVTTSLIGTCSEYSAGGDPHVHQLQGIRGHMAVAQSDYERLTNQVKELKVELDTLVESGTSRSSD